MPLFKVTLQDDELTRGWLDLEQDDGEPARYTNESFLEVKIPQNTPITTEGNFGVSTGDPVWVNGEHLSPLTGNRKQVVKEI